MVKRKRFYRRHEEEVLNANRMGWRIES